MTAPSTGKAGRCIWNKYAAAERRRRSFRAIAAAILTGGDGDGDDVKVHLLNNCKTPYVLLMISNPAAQTSLDTHGVGPHAAIGRIHPLEPLGAVDGRAGRRPGCACCFVRRVRGGT